VVDKKKLIAHICALLEKDLQAAIEAAKATYEAATHEESKPENEYDTRGLEASYLAGAQAKRVAEIEETLTTFRFMEIKNFGPDEPIGATALVEVELNSTRKSFVLIMPKGGGQVLKFEDHMIQVITPNSPLGEALIGQTAGSDVVVDTGSQSREYDIISVQ
jgi:transcription elongation GreA/GreB family factor